MNSEVSAFMFGLLGCCLLILSVVLFATAQPVLGGLVIAVGFILFCMGVYLL